MTLYDLMSEKLGTSSAPVISQLCNFGCCCCSVAKSCLTLCNPVDCSTPDSSVPHHPLEFAQIHVHLTLCHRLLLLPSVFPSIKVFPNESAFHIRWLKYWSFSFSPSKNYSGLVSFKINWFDLLVVQGTLKSLLQHHNLKSSVLRCSAFFMVQFSHLYMTTGKSQL